MFKKFFVGTILSAMIFIQPLIAYSDLLYSEKDVQTITGGVLYEKSSRLYSAGWVDIYALSIDVKNPNVELAVLESTGEFGLKQSLETMAKNNNVVAAVNGDFFGSGNPRSSMGQVLKDGQVQQEQNYYNYSENNYAGIFVDKNLTPFIDYLRGQLYFYNSSEASLELLAKNKTGDFSKPVYFDTKAITSTADIDKRTPELTKIVVTGNAISHISAPGETVSVPQNGYIIVMNKTTAAEKLGFFSVGQTVVFNESNKFIFRPEKSVSEILIGMSGGGEILRNGQSVATGLIVGKNGRNPRTVIGVDKDKTKIIIVAVDGRTNGIGLTHGEMANIMLHYGAHDAIHLDGGGSTTVVLREEAKTDLSVVNVPSEGSQRLIANGLGVRSVSPTGELANLSLKIKNNDDNKVLANTPFEILVSGTDANYNPVSVDINNVEFYVSGVTGERTGNMFTPDSEGFATVMAVSGDAAAEISVHVISPPVSIKATSNSYSLDVGESTYLQVSLLNKDGYAASAEYAGVYWTVDNPAVGYVENGKFTAMGTGVADLTAHFKEVTSTLTIAVGKTTHYISDFESDFKLNFRCYPENIGIEGTAVKTSAMRLSGSYSAGLSYKFAPNQTATQAAYLAFDDAPILLGQNITNIAVWAKGDKSGNMLRAVIMDSAKQEYTVTLSETIDYDDWTYVTAKLPTNMQYPVSLKRVYVAVLNTTSSVSGTVYIDNLTAMSPIQSSSTAYRFNDYKRLDLTSPPEVGYQDFTVFGKTAGIEAAEVKNAVIQKMQQNARAMMFAGASDVDSTSVVALKWQDMYERNGIENMAIYSIGTDSGGIRTNDYNQWKYIQQDLYNTPKNNILLVMNKDIWAMGSDGFTDKKEAATFHKVLKQFTEATGKNVMVVSACGYNTNVYVKDNVRYITLNGLSTRNTADLSSYNYLRIRLNEYEMYYDIQPVFN